MSEESNICGAETVDGGECLNPVTDDGDQQRCWIPSHNDADAENPHGRDFTITEDDHEDILQAAREGLSKSGCARAAGTGISQLQRYLDAHSDFRDAFARAREKGESKLIKRGLYDPETDSSMAKFILSTSFDYIKTEKREITGEGGSPLNVTINRERADEPE